MKTKKTKTKDTVSSLIKSARKKRGMTLRQVARASGKEISNPYVSQIENHPHHKVSERKLYLLSEILRIPFKKLVKASVNQHG